MSVSRESLANTDFSLVNPAPHSLHECQDPEEFRQRFERETGSTVQDVINNIVRADAPRAVVLVGSLPLGMGNSGSDIDFIAIVDSNMALSSHDRGVSANTDRRLAFSNESSLLAGSFVTLTNGVAVEVQVAVAPAIRQIHRRLQGRGPELSESEIMTLGRLSTGWLLSESEQFLRKNAVNLQEPALHVYCSTKHFVSALISRRKGLKSIDSKDVPLAMYLGTDSVKMAYLAYFASEGYSYLGVKWLAQIGHARGAGERVRRHPLLAEGVPLLFPTLVTSCEAASDYFAKVSEFLEQMRALMERNTLFKIAFAACPQIHHVG
jgi:hypothetical protein